MGLDGETRRSSINTKRKGHSASCSFCARDATRPTAMLLQTAVRGAGIAIPCGVRPRSARATTITRTHTTTRCTMGGLPQDTPIPRRGSAWKPKKRKPSGTDEEGRNTNGATSSSKTKLPPTKSAIIQGALSAALACAALAFTVAPEHVANGVFGPFALPFPAVGGLVQLSGALLSMMAALFFVLKELPHSYSSAKPGYVGVGLGSLLALRCLLFGGGGMALSPASVGLACLFAASLATAIVQLRIIHAYTKIRR